MRYHGTIKNGMFSNQAIIFQAYKKFEGKNVVVSVTKRKTKRTLPQNKYLNGVVYKIIGDFIGDDRDGVHESMGQKFRLYEDNNFLTKIESTADMSTERFTEYVEQVRRWASDFLNLNIPDPGEED